MKKQLVATLFLLGYVMFTTNVFAQETTTFTAKDIKKLSLSGYIKVELVKSDEEKVVFTVSPAVKRLISVQASKGRISIKGESNRLQQVVTQRPIIQVYYTQLEAIKAREEAYITGKEFIQNEKLDLLATQGSKMDLRVHTQDLKANVRTRAKVLLAGSSDVFRTKVKKGASLKALDLKTNICYVSAREQSGASVFVRETLYMSTGTGSLVQYQGNPKKVLKRRGISLSIDF
ncbi:MAG TPA: hypothetical protein DCS93_04795 [Microscillaceae bacterium]|nr:hypothetical protein [Microscillaceae bacterium]